MKRLGFIVLTLMLFFLLSVSAGATGEIDSFKQQTEESFFESIDSELGSLLEDFGINSFDGEQIFDEGSKNIGRYFSVTLKQKLSDAVSWFFSGVCIIMLISIISSAFEFSFSVDALNIFSAAIISIVTVGKISSFINCTLSAMALNGKFMLSFIPVFALLISLSGNPASALTYNSFLLFFCEAISFFLENIYLSVIRIYFSLCVAFSFNPTVNLSRFINGANRITSLALGTSATAFTSLLSVKNVLAVSADSLSVKGVRFLLSSLVPVIGSSLSEAYSSVLGSINLMKSSVAVVGIFALVIINIPALTEGVVYFFLMTVLSCLAEIIGLYRVAEIYRGLASCVRNLLLVSVFHTFVLIISIGIMLTLK